MEGDELARADSEWLPKPLPDPRLLRRMRRARWEVGVATVLYAAAGASILGSLYEMYTLFTSESHRVRALAPLLIIAFDLIIVCMTVVSTSLWLRAMAHRAVPGLSDLVDLPAAFPQFPVSVKYRAVLPRGKGESARYGSDMGIVSFVDGYMHFQGERTSWSLTVSDLGRTPWKKQEVFKQPFKAPTIHAIRWETEVETFELRIVAMDRMDGLGAGLSKGFDQAAVRWLEEPPPPREPHRLPPMRPAPGVLAARRTVYRVLSAFAWIPRLALLAALVSSPWWDYAWPAAFYIAIACVIVEIPRALVRNALSVLNRLSDPEDRLEFDDRDPWWWRAINFRLY